MKAGPTALSGTHPLPGFMDHYRLIGEDELRRVYLRNRP